MAIFVYAIGWPLVSVGIVVLPILLFTPWYGSTLSALMAPIAIYAMLPMLGNALYHVLTSARISWKGREI
ncbi:MAG: hypothetical protein WDO18_14855 [Acidobacteriota bacterium]